MGKILIRLLVVTSFLTGCQTKKGTEAEWATAEQVDRPKTSVDTSWKAAEAVTPKAVEAAEKKIEPTVKKSYILHIASFKNRLSAEKLKQRLAKFKIDLRDTRDDLLSVQIRDIADEQKARELMLEVAKVYTESNIYCTFDGEFKFSLNPREAVRKTASKKEEVKEQPVEKKPQVEAPLIKEKKAKSFSELLKESQK